MLEATFQAHLFTFLLHSAILMLALSAVRSLIAVQDREDVALQCLKGAYHPFKVKKGSEK